MLRYADKAAEGMFVDRAYRKTQPERLMQEKTLEQELEEKEKEKRDREGSGPARGGGKRTSR